MPWLVSIRISGQTKGASLTTATRRSVIFKSEGLELRLTFCTAASSVSSDQKPAPAATAADRRKLRRPNPRCDFMLSILLPLPRARDILFAYIKCNAGRSTPEKGDN